MAGVSFKILDKKIKYGMIKKINGEIDAGK